MRLSEKTEWQAIDFCKFFSALVVVAIHFPPFEDVNATVSFLIKNVMCRLAVPFFFLAAGFFLEKKIRDRKQVWNYTCHLVRMYVIYTILYLPQVVRDSWVSGPGEFVRRFFLKGSYIQLWFFTGLIAAVVFLYVIVNILKMDDGKLLLLSGILYGIGVMGNAYRSLLYHISALRPVLKLYYSYFETTRNGLFFGLPFVALGYLLKKHAFDVMKHGYKKWMLFFWGLMAAETAITVKITGWSDRDMIFTIVPAATCLFLSVCFMVGKECRGLQAKKARKLSTLIFGLQYLVGFYLEEIYGMLSEGKWNSLEEYLVVAALTVACSVAILRLSEYRHFRWMRYLY